MQTITFRIQRYDGTRQWFQEYPVSYEPGKTILWALTKIREEQDPTLNFTSACRHAICGSCAVRVNGHAFLACKTSLDELLRVFATDRLTLTPLNNFPVIRDLVVDWKPKTERMKTVKPWLIPEPGRDEQTEYTQSPQDFHAIASPTDCILCGICSSQCEQLAANMGYLDPFILNRAYRFAADSRDTAPQEHVLPATQNDLWKCLHCYQCVTQCPKEIRLDREIAYLRRASMRMGQTDNPGARHAYAFHQDVREKGRLNELTLPIKTEGMVRTLRRIPFAVRAIRRGKINPLHVPREVSGIEVVRKLYAYVEGEKQQ